MERVRIWTDGCCLRNPGGPGGWAFVVERHGNVIHEASGGARETTNNRMELAAAIEAMAWALEHLGPVAIEVISDSKYVVDGATSWVHKWKRNGWRMKKGRPIAPKNVVLWKQVEGLSSKGKISFSWVKGHAGRTFNERADELATIEARASRQRRTALITA